MAVQFLPEVKVLKACQLLNSSTSSEWETQNPILPANMMAYASDTKVIKIGDGVHKYSELPVFFTQGMVDTVQHVRFVADIAERDALEDKNGLVVVYDTTADPTVDDNMMAGYFWDPVANENAGAWVKIFEKESMDVDLAGYFKKDTDTADSISDGLTKVMMLATEREQLAELVEDAVRYTDTLVIQGTNAAETLAMLDQAAEEESENESGE